MASAMMSVVCLVVVSLFSLTHGQGQSQVGKEISNTKGCSGFYKPGVNPKTTGNKYQDCVIQLVQGKEHATKAYFRLDEPIICQNKSVECAVIVTITSSDDEAVSVEPCQVKWTPNQWRETRFVEIFGNVKVSNNDKNVKVHLNTSVITSAEYYKNVDVDDMYFVSENLKVASCSANGDPHYHTLDGRYWHFYNKNPGPKQNRVTLHRSSQPGHDYIVQNQLRGYPARNCGIAAREGRNRVIIDACSGPVQRQVDFHTPYAAHRPVVEISGSTYSVYFRSGAMIRVRGSRSYVGVTIEGVDYGHSCGICGNFNGDPWDDGTEMLPGQKTTYGCRGGWKNGRCVQPQIDEYDDLSSCTKVPSTFASGPLRYPSGLEYSGEDIWEWEYSGRVCNDSVTTNCYPDEEAPPPADSSCPAELGVVRPLIDTRPGSIEDVTDDLLQLNEDIHDRCQGRDNCNGWKWTDDNGQLVEHTPYDLDKSKTICTDHIHQDLPRILKCVIYFGSEGNTLRDGKEGTMIEALKANSSAVGLASDTYDYDEYIDDCANDYSALGGPNNSVSAVLLNSTVRRMDRDCMELCIATDCKRYDPELRDDLTSALCEEACNGHGTCGAMGVCTCEEGYGASDCSINLNAPPSIDIISEKAYDVTGHSPDNIDEIRVYGSNFQQHANASCRWGDPSDPDHGHLAQITRAHWIGPSTIICEIPGWHPESYVNKSYFDKSYIHSGPDALEMILRVSNDGVLWSDEDVVFEFYDGVCEVCSHENGKCHPNPESCIVTDPFDQSVTCYPDHTGNDENPCEECKASTGVRDRLTFDSNLNELACRPQFSQRDYEFILYGATTKGHEVGSLDATANEFMTNAPGYSIKYEYIHTGNDGTGKQFFDVETTRGVGLVKTIVDIDPVVLCMNLQHACENTINYHSGFQVKATDNFGVSTTIGVDVPLLPDKSVDDPFPVGGFNGTIPENAQPGDPVKFPNGSNLVIPFDLDRKWFHVHWEWYRVDQEGNQLVINPDTGAITVGGQGIQGVLDHETNPFITNVVAAEELDENKKFNNFFLTQVNITVTDVPEKPSVVQNATSGLALQNIIVEESVGPEVYYAADDVGKPRSILGCSGPCGNIVPITATDPEDAPEDLTFTIVGNTHGFEIADGFLKSTQEFDFEDENPNTFDLTIRVTDPGGLFTESTVSVTIRDINEGMSSIRLTNPPQKDVVDNTPEQLSVTVSRGFIATTVDDIAIVDATDIDGDKVDCTVSSRYFHVVRKNSDKMVLQRKQLTCFDHEETSLTVFCDDSLAKKPTNRSNQVVYTIKTGEMDVKPKLVGWVSATSPFEEGVVTTEKLLGTATFKDEDTTQGSITVTTNDDTLYRVESNNDCADDGVALTCSVKVYLRAGVDVSFEDESNDNGVFTIVLSGENGETPNAVETCIGDDTPVPTFTVTDVAEVPIGVETNPASLVVPEDAKNGDVVGTFILIDDDASSTYTSVTTSQTGAFGLSLLGRRDRRQANSNSVWEITVVDAAKLNYQNSDSMDMTITVVEGSLQPTYTIPISIIDVKPKIVSTGGMSISRDSLNCPTDVTFKVENVDTQTWLNALTWVLESDLSQYGVLETDPSDKTIATFKLTKAVPVDILQLTAKVTADFGSLVSNFGVNTLNQVTTSDFFDVAVTTVRKAPVVGTIPAQTVPYTGEANETISLVDVTATEGTSADSFFVRVVRYPPTQGFQTQTTLNHAPSCTQNNRYVQGGTGTAVTVDVLDTTFVGCSLPANTFTCNLKLNSMPAVQAGTSLTGGQINAFGVLFPNATGIYVMSSFRRNGEDVVSFAPLTVTFDKRPTFSPTASPTDSVTIIIGESKSGGENNTVGVAVGVVVGLIILLLVVAAFIFYHRNQKRAAKDIFKDNGSSHYNDNPTYATEGAYESPEVLRPGIENPLYSWYRPKMTRKECSDYLSGLGEGAFVVRDSEANPGWHMLGVKNQNDVVHEKIRLCQNQTYQLIVTGGSIEQPQLQDLPTLVSYYLEPKEDVPYTLMDCDPIYDNGNLLQERLGVTKMVSDNGPLDLPSKNTEYADIPVGSGVGGDKLDDSVGNPMYFSNDKVAESTYSEADGYLDIKPDGAKADNDTGSKQPYLDVSPEN